MTIHQPRKIVLIAGVGSGLGSALVEEFADQGCAVGMIARSKAKLEAIKQELDPKTNGEIFCLPCDVANADHVVRAVAKTREDFGNINTLIFNASSARWQGLLDGTADGFQEAWKTSVLGAWLLAKAVVVDMIDAKSGTMIFTGATSSVRGRAHAADFSSARFGLRGLAQSLAEELGPKGVHVAHVLVDGIIDTEHQGSRTEEEEMENASSEVDPKLKPADIAKAYASLERQPANAWTHELDIRPMHEALFE